MPAKGVHGPVSEFDLIERIALRAARRPGTELGVGDDAAILRVGADAVVAQDLLVDNVHFRLSTTGARDLGHKALAVNLSDIGAMGAEPIAAFVGLVLPPAGFTDDDFDALYDGMEELAARFGVTVAGGDLTGGPALTLAVTVVGRPHPGVVPLRRDGAGAGDLLCVTGGLGAAAAGFLLLEDPGLAEGIALAETLRAAQRRPEPRVDQGRRLAGHGATAMMDLSDGLALDGGRLAVASGLRAVIDLDAIPVAPGVDAVAEATGQDKRILALTGGEDYELLVAVPPDRLDALRALLDLPLTPVGALEAGTPGLEVRDGDGRAIALTKRGWEHDL